MTILDAETKKLIQTNSDTRADELLKIKSCISVLANHIEVLEKKNQGFLGKFKLFKQKGVKEDLNNFLSEQEKLKFNFND